VEAVRLVIWDLDETFWKGTITEGGYQYSQAAHDIVIELARRGIISSICSKNDRDKVEDILKKHDILDYFVLTSIDWSGKGERIAKIVSLAQLRPETVLFIDDNPGNLAEARHYCPGIQTADETFVSEMLSDARFTGKNDHDLSRLKQYKVLEQKHQDEAMSGGDRGSFLKQSQIRVFIDYNIEANIDRAVELINRTNQLNFTKSRLPEDPAQAREALLEALKSHQAGAGLVYAADRYGDYGCIGFYLMWQGEGIRRRFVHYCFSCRTLGMNIETWLFHKLGKPQLSVQGEVLTDVHNSEEPTWISEVGSLAELAAPGETREKLGTLIVKGGCDVRAIEHYLENSFSRVVEEMNDLVDGFPLRVDHSLFARYAIENVSDEAKQVLLPFGYQERHFQTEISNLKPGSKDVIILSLWSDGRLRLYRDKRTGIKAPIVLPRVLSPNYLQASTADLEDRHADHKQALEAIQCLREHFEYADVYDVKDYAETVAQLVDYIPQDTLVFFIQTPEFWFKPDTGERYETKRETILNGINREIIAGKKNFCLINPWDFADRNEYLDHFHYSRNVYFKIAEKIKAVLEDYYYSTSGEPQSVIEPVEA